MVSDNDSWFLIDICDISLSLRTVKHLKNAV